MNRLKWTFAALVIATVAFTSSLAGQESPGPEGIGPEAEAPDPPPATGEGIWQRETLTDGWFGLGRRLEQQGITVNLALTQVYQQNLSGGLSTNSRKGRYAGSYDLEALADLETLAGIPGATLFAHAQGAWTMGVDPWSVGSAVGNANADAVEDRGIDLTQLYWQQSFLEDRLQVRLGKLDITGGFECRERPVAFDANAYANDEALQFLNAALVNNPTIPLPDYGLGLAAFAQPVDGWYVAVGAIDAQGDYRETGFNTAFHDEDYFFAVAETGLAVDLPLGDLDLPGTYRAGLWYDPRDKTEFETGRTRRDDVGVYLSLDQELFRESDKNDGQGLGAFARWGWADSDVNEITCFWSAGLAYQGLIPTRDRDVIALGVARGKLVTAAGYQEEYETAYELYYGLWLAPWVQISPSLQYVQHPGGDPGIEDAFVVGLRVQMAF
jgi:porin